MKTTVPVLLAALALPAVAQETHPFSVHDMLAMERISDAQVSPDGAWVVYTVRTTDLEANRGRTDLWLSSVDGATHRQLTTDPAADFHPRWSGERVLFLSTRGGSSQVWSLSPSGGEATQVTDLPLDVGGFAPFPDGERLALAMEVYPDAETLEETAQRDEERASSPVKARIYDELLFRHWDTWEDGKRSHVFVWRPGSQPVDLMKGVDADCPTRPFGGSEDFVVAPDGSSVVYVAKVVGREAAWSTDVDLWKVPADGSAPATCLTEDNEAWDTGPVFSPDGTTLAYLAMERPGYESDRLRIVLLGADGSRRVLTDRWDRSAGEITWSEDGRTIYTSTPDLGNRSIFSVDVATGVVKRLAHVGTNRGVAIAGDRLLYANDTLSSPVELFTMDRTGGDVHPVTRRNAAKVAAARMGEYEQFTFTGAHGDKVYGWVMKPADFEEGQEYPVAFLIHGGPQGSFGNHFHYRWNPQAYAGAGYAAVFIDFHGSTGYGQAFTDSINQDWGGAPFEDLMTGLDFALEEYPFLDGDRVGALGASFGGFMINWAAGQTDRFRCMVNHDGNLDERAAYFMTEELWFPEWDHGGRAFDPEAMEGYEKHNPVHHVHKWKTPMLVIHGALDFRVVETEGFATFTALQRMGIPSKLLYFPDENHWVLKPLNSILWHETVIDWLDQWCR